MLPEIDSGLLIIIIGLILRHGHVGLTKKTKARPVLLDSCALMDGRVLAIAQTGFMAGVLIIIPEFILHELQLLADGKDAYKRQRARLGLDVARQLQQLPAISVRIDKADFTVATDDKLLALARKRHAVLCTTDFNLNKVATIVGIEVLNVNELSRCVRMIALPGETVTVKLTQKGKNRDQAVGYLDDGTMVVVERAGRFLDKMLAVTITGVHQTDAGKMTFAKPAEG